MEKSLHMPCPRCAVAGPADDCPVCQGTYEVLNEEPAYVSASTYLDSRRLVKILSDKAVHLNITKLYEELIALKYILPRRGADKSYRKDPRISDTLIRNHRCTIEEQKKYYIESYPEFSMLFVEEFIERRKIL